MEEPLKNKRYSLFNMLGMVKGIYRDLKCARGKVYDEEQKLHQIAKEYSTKRIALLEMELQAQGMTWCTICSEAIPESKTTLLFFKGKKEESSGYGRYYYSHEKFSQLHRACPKCRKEAADDHRKKGKYDSQLKSQTYFYAFRVKKREDGYYICKFGKWSKLDDKDCEFPKFPIHSTEYIAREIGIDLPPKVDVSWPKAELKVLE